MRHELCTSSSRSCLSADIEISRPVLQCRLGCVLTAFVDCSRVFLTIGEWWAMSLQADLDVLAILYDMLSNNVTLADTIQKDTGRDLAAAV